MENANESAGRAASPRRLIAVFGGTGFLGRRIVKHLLENEFDVRAVSRHPHRMTSMFGLSTPRLTSLRADVHNEAEVAVALEGAYGAVNAVSLYVEHGRETFRAVHVEAAARVARVAREARVEHLLMSLASAPIQSLLPLTSGHGARANRQCSEPLPIQRSFGRPSCSARMMPSSPRW